MRDFQNSAEKSLMSLSDQSLSEKQSSGKKKKKSKHWLYKLNS